MGSSSEPNAITFCSFTFSLEELYPVIDHREISAEERFSKPFQLQELVSLAGGGGLHLGWDLNLGVLVYS